MKYFLISFSLYAQWYFGNATIGEAIYDSPGTYNFTVPAGVFSISYIVVGAGGQGGFGGNPRTTGGGGGATCWNGNMLVAPGQVIAVTVGNQAQASVFGSTTAGAGATGANSTGNPGYSAGGTGSGGGATCYTGGQGGAWTGSGQGYSSGGGGAAGYSGNGGKGGDSSGSSCPGGPVSGSGGGGAGGSASCSPSNSGSGCGSGGGGVGIYGAGASGTAGANQNVTGTTGCGTGGPAGSNGLNGQQGYQGYYAGAGGQFGGGEGGGYYGAHGVGAGTGAVRVIWGLNRSFPSNAGSINYDPVNNGVSTIASLPTGAYSFRKLRTAYTGPAIRVRRSNDNAESDIGFKPNGDFDIAALQAFVGANSGFVRTWYNQNDSGIHATQTALANQPRIVNAGVVDIGSRPTIPAMYLDGNMWLDTNQTIANITLGGKDGTVFNVANITNGNPWSWGVANDAAGSARWMAHQVYNYIAYFDAGNSTAGQGRCQAAGSPALNWQAWAFVKTSTANFVYWGRSDIARCSNTTNNITYAGAVANFCIGRICGPSAPQAGMVGYLTEFIVYKSGIQGTELTNFLNDTVDYYGLQIQN